MEPAEEEAHDENAAAGAEADGHDADFYGEDADEHAEDAGDAHENEIGFFGGQIGETDEVRGAFDVFGASGEFEDVAAFDACVHEAWQCLALAGDAPEMNTACVRRRRFGELT